MLTPLSNKCKLRVFFYTFLINIITKPLLKNLEIFLLPGNVYIQVSLETPARIPLGSPTSKVPMRFTN